MLVKHMYILPILMEVLLFYLSMVSFDCFTELSHHIIIIRWIIDAIIKCRKMAGQGSEVLPVVANPSHDPEDIK